MTDEEARKRLLLYTMTRAFGVGLFLFGLAVIYTGVLRPGGWPQVGAMIAIAGALDALIAPHLLKRAWDKQDREQR